MKKIVDRLYRWAVAVVVTAALGSVVQTQLNMNAVVALEAPLGFGTRMWATLQDLMFFAPRWALLVGVAMAIGFGVAALIVRHRPRASIWLYPLAGGASVLTLILLMNNVLPMTPIAATRTVTGTLLMAAPGIIGGWLFFRLKKRRSSRRITG